MASQDVEIETPGEKAAEAGSKPLHERAIGSKAQAEGGLGPTRSTLDLRHRRVADRQAEPLRDWKTLVGCASGESRRGRPKICVFGLVN